MIFADYSPPVSPSLDQQRDALRKGLGRAVMLAAAGRLNESVLLAACLEDQRFDTQIDASRTNWLWGMMQLIGAVDRFRVPILHTLYDLSDQDNGTQLCEFGRCYAATGDDTFRNRLYEIVEQKPFDQTPWLGEEEVIALDGEAGFLFAAGVRGLQLLDREWESDDDRLVWVASERFGEGRIKSLLASSPIEAVAQFGDDWLSGTRRRASARRSDTYAERMAYPLERVLQAVEGKDQYFWLRGWGKRADDAVVRAVAERLWAAREPTVIANLLNILSARALTEFDARLIDLCRHDDPEVRRRAFQALEPNHNPLVREFALAELAKGAPSGPVIDLFINNYEVGDEQRILDAIEPPADENELHWLFRAVIKVLEANPGANPSQLGVIAYILNPCTGCRYDAAKLLHNCRCVPDWLKDEVRFDAEENSRSLGERAVGSTPTA